VQPHHLEKKIADIKSGHDSSLQKSFKERSKSKGKFTSNLNQSFKSSGMRQSKLNESLNISEFK